MAGERGGGALVDVRDLEYIIAIAQEGSLSGAGRRLGVSQPTLSAFLAGLERQLGADLFVRDHKRMLPTPAGRICLDAARRIVNVKEQTYQTIHRLTHEPEETIVIGATPLRGSIMVAQITLVMEITEPTDRSTPPSRMMYIWPKVSRIMPMFSVRRLRRFRAVKK